jgi:hypothetical protein
MSLAGQLALGRSDRVTVDRAGTLRDVAKNPIDVVVDNLSTTGCLLKLDQPLPLGALVSVGIPGIGIRYARIGRIDHPHYACAFLAPVSAAEIAVALSAETIVEGAFPVMPAQAAVISLGTAVTNADEHYDERRFPAASRVALIGGTSILLWVVIIGGVIAIIH